MSQKTRIKGNPGNEKKLGSQKKPIFKAIDNNRGNGKNRFSSRTNR